MLATPWRRPEDIVTDEVGVLVPVDDPRAPADRITHVLDHCEEYPPQALRVHAVSNFSAPPSQAQASLSSGAGLGLAAGEIVVLRRGP